MRSRSAAAVADAISVTLRGSRRSTNHSSFSPIVRAVEEERPGGERWARRALLFPFGWARQKARRVPGTDDTIRRDGFAFSTVDASDRHKNGRQDATAAEAKASSRRRRPTTTATSTEARLEDEKICERSNYSV